MIVEKTINKEKYVFRFTSLTMRKVCEYKNIEFHEYDGLTVGDYSGWVNALLRAAIDVGSKGAKALTEYEMDELIEDMAQSDLQDLINAYLESVKNLREKYHIETPETEAQKKN